ncbi:MAG: class I SAM-dependent methyltransferase, partial [Pirellulales bacterium]|nr:class I SAM-dependent methyltransferase [Pirellulales bacterium]
MNQDSEAVIRSAAEVFALRVPVYDFDYRGGQPGLEPSSPIASGLGSEETTREDRLEDLAQLPWPNGVARTVICRGALEHVFEPRRAIDEMIRILKPGGILVVVSANELTPGGAMNRYWTITPPALQRLLGVLPASLIGWRGDESAQGMVFGVACKDPVPGEFAAGVNRFVDLVQERLDTSVTRTGWLGWLLGGWPLAHGKSNGRTGPVQFAFHLPLGEGTKKDLLTSHL